MHWLASMRMRWRFFSDLVHRKKALQDCIVYMIRWQGLREFLVLLRFTCVPPPLRTGICRDFARCATAVLLCQS